MNNISVILPTYNEAENIVPLIAALNKHVTGLKEILVVDDDSPDGTAALVKGPKTRLVVRRTDHGLTKSIQKGINLARGDIIVWMDADFSMPPSDINTLTKAVQEGYDIAVGSRFVSGGKAKQRGDPKEHWYAILASQIGNAIMPALFGLNFHDYTSGFIAVKKTVIRSIPLRGNYGEYFIDFIVRAFRKKYRIVEIPYVCKPRMRGSSKTTTNFFMLITRIVQYGSTILRLAWHR